MSKDTVIGIFNYAEEKSYLKILIRRFWEKSGVEGGLVALQFFWSLKKGMGTFNFRYNEPSLEVLGSLGRCDHPLRKTTTKNKKQINTHP